MIERRAHIKIYECKGNISKAAELLQIDRSSLYKKMKYYEIPYARKDDEPAEARR